MEMNINLFLQIDIKFKKNTTTKSHSDVTLEAKFFLAILGWTTIYSSVSQMVDHVLKLGCSYSEEDQGRLLYIM